jgi:uncharacterized protein YoaH (UPF0181 family)
MNDKIMISLPEGITEEEKQELIDNIQEIVQATENRVSMGQAIDEVIRQLVQLKKSGGRVLEVTWDNELKDVPISGGWDMYNTGCSCGDNYELETGVRTLTIKFVEKS